MKKEQKELAKNVCLLLITIILFFLFLEITLRIFPGMFGQAVENQLKTKYNSAEQGIYIFNPDTKIRMMKPNFETTAYYNGYYWNHKTDSRGFRNEKEYSQADIILLGDSMIYGHGLDFNKTMPFFLEQNTNYSVYNMARQGDSVFEEKYILFNYAKQLNPKYVFYFFFELDAADLSVKLNKKEIDFFVSEQDLNDFTVKEFPEKQNTGKNITKWILEKSNLALALYTISTMQNQSNLIPEEPLFNSAEWKYEEKSLKQMKLYSDSINAELIIVPLTKIEEQKNKLKEIAEQNSIEFLDTKELMFNENFRLENDRHLNEQGQKELALIIEEYLKQKDLN